MECVYKDYIYHTYPQIYFNKLDECYYQMKVVRKEEFNSERYNSLEKCKSKFYRVILYEDTNKVIVNFGLCTCGQQLIRVDRAKITVVVLVKLLIQILEAITLLRTNNTYHGNISASSIFVNDDFEISLCSFYGLNKNEAKECSFEKDYQDSIKTVLSLLYDKVDDNYEKINY